MTPFRAQKVEATAGFEPANRGFADTRKVRFALVPGRSDTLARLPGRSFSFPFCYQEVTV